MRSAPSQYRKKPVTITAVQWTGENLKTVTEFIDVKPEISSMIAGMMWDRYEEAVSKNGLKIPTLEGVMSANIGDWIIRGIKGEYYPCKPDVFAATYEPAEVINA